MVETTKELNDFLELPYILYKNDPNWVPPLRSEQKNQFILQKNPMLEHCCYQLFLLYQDDRVAGRIAAFTDQLALETWKQPIGLIGSFECINNQEAAHLLLESAKKWNQSQGMKWMRGPWSFASQEWGLVIEGYSPPPVIFAPYNPPYYNDFLSNFGFAKVKDLMVYVIDAGKG